MSAAVSLDPYDAERRVHYARFMLYLSILPTVVGAATFVTTVLMGGLPGLNAPALVLTQVLASALFSSLYLLAAWLIGRRERSGALIAFLLFAWAFANAFSGRASSIVGALIALVGLVYVIRAWPVLGLPAGLAES